MPINDKFIQANLINNSYVGAQKYICAYSVAQASKTVFEYVKTLACLAEEFYDDTPHKNDEESKDDNSPAVFPSFPSGICRSTIVRI